MTFFSAIQSITRQAQNKPQEEPWEATHLTIGDTTAINKVISIATDENAVDEIHRAATSGNAFCTIYRGDDLVTLTHLNLHAREKAIKDLLDQIRKFYGTEFKVSLTDNSYEGGATMHGVIITISWWPSNLT